MRPLEFPKNLPAVDSDGLQAAGTAELAETSVHEPLGKAAVHRQDVRAHTVLLVPNRWEWRNGLIY